MTLDEIERELLEQLADLEHQQWIEWAGTIMKQEPISEERRNRWLKLFGSYKDLSENVKEQDRKWARKIIKIYRTHIVKLLGRIIEEAYDKDFGTYDYKAIADKVISLVKDEK